MDRDTVKLSKLCHVRRAWAQEMHGGRFRGKQPEQLTAEEIYFLRALLARNTP
jgi:hypothetical protein